MRDVVLAMFMSLDGYSTGPGGEFFGPAFSPDLKTHWIDRNLDRAGTMMYGRVAYQGMVQFWTSPQAPAEEAAALAEMDKLVFSRTLDQADWGRVSIVRSDIPGNQAGKDMVLIAGATIANEFLRLDLIDELCLLIVPVLKGGGSRLFQEGTAPAGFKLTEALPFDSGVVRLTYRK